MSVKVKQIKIFNSVVVACSCLEVSFTQYILKYVQIDFRDKKNYATVEDQQNKYYME